MPTANSRLNACVCACQLRPPPPKPPDDFLSTLQPGDELEMFYEDGWWEVNYLSSRTGEHGAIEYTVESTQYVACPV